MIISIEAYSMLMRAFKHYGYEKADELKKEYLEELIQNLRIKKGKNNINAPGLLETEYEMLAYRYGFFDGKIKLFTQTAKMFSTTVDHAKRIEERTIMKIINAIKIANKNGKRKSKKVK